MNRFLESITDGFATYNREWRITFVNQRAAQLMGQTPERLIGRNLWEVFPEAVESTFYREFHRAISEEIPVYFQEYYAPLNSWFEVRAYPSPAGLTVLFHDITSRKKTEEALEKAYGELEYRVLERTLQLTRTSTLLEIQTAACQRAETALRTTNEQLATILESITDGFYALDHQWQFTYVNRKAEQILQKNQSELLHRNIWELYPRAIGSTFYYSCRKAARTGLPAQLEEFCEHLNIWLDVKVYPSPDGLSIYFQDITSRKQAEERLQKWAQIFEHAHWGVVVGSADGIQIEMMNPTFASMHGYTLEELIGKPILDVFAPECRKEVAEQIEIAHERGHYTWESQHIRKDGSIFPVLIDATTVKAEDGSVLYRVVNVQDITERKQQEEERHQLLIREQKARARAEIAHQRCIFLSEASTVLASSLDYRTTLVSVLRLVVPFLADYCLIHKLEDDGELRQVTALHRDPQKQELVNELGKLYQLFVQNPNSFTAQVLRTGEPMLIPETSYTIANSVSQDARVLEIFRQLNPKSAMIVPLAARGQIFGAISFLSAESEHRYDESDFTLAGDLARRAAMAIDNAQLYHQAQESNRLKDEFLATLSHELRTPMNAILGWAQMLVRRSLDQKTLQLALETIERKAKEQVQLIYDLLDVSRIVTGKFCLNPGWVVLGSVIQEAVESLQLAAEAKSIQLEVDFDPSVGLVRGDHKYLRQVVWNLLSNAIRFTPNGGRVEIQLRRVEDIAQIQVIDTGDGISPQFLPHVFDRFRQANSAITRRYGGLGLGLALVRHLVELHGGTVQAYSLGEGKGSTFTIRLPIPSTVSSSAESASQVEKSLDGTLALFNDLSILAGLRLLVVDDDPDCRELVTFMLKEHGAEVIRTASLSEALDGLERLQPDILISDLGMPAEERDLLMKRLKAVEAQRGKPIPAIALTAYAGEIERRRALAAGFQMHLSKPVDLNELVAVIARLVGLGTRG